MTETWLDRLHIALKKETRSLRAISVEAGYGPNYLQQMLKDGKEPGAAKLAKILDVLGRDASLYVLTGISMTEEDREFLDIVTRMKGPVKEDALRLLRSVQAGATSQEQPDDHEG